MNRLIDLKGWLPIHEADIPKFDRKFWFEHGPSLLLLNSYGERPYIGRYCYTNRGKGRWKSDSGYVCEPAYFQRLPETPKWHA